MVNLQVLILQDNLIESLHEVSGLRGAGNLRHLVLAGNPVAEPGAKEYSKWDSMYRFDLLQMIPQLIAIDCHVCTDDEHLYWPDCKSLRFRSKTTFAEFSFSIFQSDLSANAHVNAH